MPRTLADVVEQLLRDADASPRPWHPDHAEPPDGLSREQLDGLVRQLFQAKLLEKDPHESGYRVTTPARMLLRDPEALARFRHDLDAAPRRSRRWELPADASPRQRIIYETLHTPIKPQVNNVLIGLNVAVFVLGLVLTTSKGGSVDSYLLSMQGDGIVAEVRHRIGMLRFADLTTGEPLQWLRLLSCCFVHFGLLHLGMNMYAQYSLGRDVEWLWGRWRFLVIYLLAGLGGTCTAAYMAFNVTWPNGPPANAAIAGASGAICGLLGAEAMWLVLNRKCLPEGLASSQLRSLGMTGVLIVIISLLPGISGSAHFGGAAVGAIASLLWHGQRFGGRSVQVLCIVGLVALPVLCVLPLRPRARIDGPAALMEVRQVHRDSLSLDESTIDPLIRVRPQMRDQAKVQRALDALPPLIERLERAAKQVERPDGVPEGVTDEERRAAQDYFSRRTAQYRHLLDHLQKGTPVSVPEENEFKKVRKSSPKWLD